MQEELNGDDETLSDSERSLEILETEATDQEESDLPPSHLEKVSFLSMDILTESSSMLLNIMKDSTKGLSDDVVKDGIQKLDYSRAELAINAANAISKTIQTQVNFVKAIKDIEM